MKVTDKYISKVIELVIYVFFTCMTIYHFADESRSILFSVIYFSLTNLSVVSLVFLLAFKKKQLTDNAKNAIKFYLIYLLAFTGFLIIIGIHARSYDEYMAIMGNCIGAVFYASVLGLIAILKLIIHGLRRRK